jgi:hypothetical protein
MVWQAVNLAAAACKYTEESNFPLTNDVLAKGASD